MTRLVSLRITAPLVALVFVAMGARGALRLDDCPRHGHALPAGHAAHHTGGSAPASPEGSSLCTCIGACHLDAGGSAVPPPATPVALVAPSRLAAAPAVPDRILPGPRRYVLPPALAPPSAS